MKASKLSVRRRLAGAVGGVVSGLLREAGRMLVVSPAGGRNRPAAERLEERVLFDYVPSTCSLIPGNSFYPSSPPGPCTECPCVQQPTQSAVTAAGGAPASMPGTTGDPQLGTTTPEAAEYTNAPVRYFDGQPRIDATDLTSDGFGKTWGQTRSYDDSGTSYTTGQSANGNRWDVVSLPHLVQAEANSTTPYGLTACGAPYIYAGAAPTIIVVASGTDQRVYDTTNSGATY